MIDIHCHILPQVDDGASNLDEAIEMARAAVKDGIRTVIATPHHQNGRYYNEKQAVRTQVEVLNDALTERDIPLEVLCGQEVRLYEGILDDNDRGMIQSLNNSDYILVEFPSSKIPKFTEDLFYEIYLIGKIPVIAHPERNKAIADNPELLYNLVSNGALAQLTSHSISGGLGRKLQKLSLELCRRNLIHLIASDAHNNDTRPFMLSEAFRVISDQIDPGMTGYFHRNARCIIDNLPIKKHEPIRARRKWYSFG